MKRILFPITITLFILTGCQNDADDQQVDPTVEESKEAVDASATALSDDIVTLVQSQGVNELVHLIDLIENHQLVSGRTSQQAWTKSRLKAISHLFVNGPSARVGVSNPKTFEDIKGLYVWNSDLQDFDFQESEFFTVQFPTEGSETNNAEFQITTLELVTIEDVNGDFVDIYEVPVAITGYLKVDGEAIVELSYEVDWSAEGTPEKANVDLLVSPFTFIINFTDTFDKSTSLLASISINGELITSIDVDVSYETESKADPYLIEGNVQYRSLKIDGNLDAREIGLNGDPNSFIDLALYSGDSKIGDVIFVLEEDEEGYQDYIPYVQYEDGTRENLEDLLRPVFEEIETIFAEFE